MLSAVRANQNPNKRELGKGRAKAERALQPREERGQSWDQGKE